jgi:molybdopterin converting factor small subunit
MQVTIELFGRASSQTGERSVTVEVPDGASLRTVGEALAARYPVLNWIPEICRPARNLEYAHWDDVVLPGDEVSFIPPVSGGAPAVKGS